MSGTVEFRRQTSVIKSEPVYGIEELWDDHTVVWLENDTGITESGGAVSKWTDIANEYELIPYASDGSAATSDNYPSWTEAGGVVFDGTDDVLKYVVSGWTTFGTVYAVVKQITWANSDTFFAFSGTGSVRVAQRTTGEGSSPNVHAASSTGYSLAITNLPLDTWGLITLEPITDSTDIIIQLNDNTAITYDDTNLGSYTSAGVILGATHAAAPALQRYGNVAIKAIIFRDQIDDSATRAAIKAYLTEKYL